MSQVQIDRALFCHLVDRHFRLEMESRAYRAVLAVAKQEIREVADRFAFLWDIAVETESVQIESFRRILADEWEVEVGVVDLSGVGLVAVGATSDLDVATVRRIEPKLGGNVALHNLHVIEVHLHLQIFCIDSFADGIRITLCRDEKTGHVSSVDRFKPQCAR